MPKQENNRILSVNEQDVIDYLERIGWHRLPGPLRYTPSIRRGRPMLYVDFTYDGEPIGPHIFLDPTGFARISSMDELRMYAPSPEVLRVFVELFL